MSSSDLSSADGASDSDDIDYYEEEDVEDIVDESQLQDDPEYFKYEVLTIADVDRLLNESVARLHTNLKIKPALAKMLLHRQNWSVEHIESSYQQHPEKLLIECRLQSSQPVQAQASDCCGVCYDNAKGMMSSACGHVFCKPCWSSHIQVQISYGSVTDIECMARGCRVILTEDMVLDLLTDTSTREKYQRFAFQAYVNMHPCLRYCPGPGCSTIIYAKVKKERKVTCCHCSRSFCFACGTDYHAPTHCDTIQCWLAKCRDDSETANYISANTKDCPKCHVCIEKNGGCNHIMCSKCKHDFCWVCEGDWKDHAGEYYQCSRYKKNPDMLSQKDKTEAREALHKYLHYFTRWDNHAKSLSLEEDESKRIRERIEAKVEAMEGTWIDWQYLLDATHLLRRCRYTLQYTYPYAYFLCNDSDKNLFELLQAKLEVEVENLSWKVQNAEITDRGDLENQMNIAEKMRLTLLKDIPSHDPS